ncbi:CRISPR-associated endonuclease Cas2 [Phocaeicola coprophilus]|jgi:CRISPR-associated protein Cas2|uniref:CRISPR-associated endoribonuclease Cas2 n=2 Tax=Phocaeicola coprophilus TaxID=387090 RepID=S0F949_9BACT|nr:CRISPR-associated endonuclease Cas2 [Phocaeicola coprophilus]EEF76904.1 CRISPR-associated protein Cas2 [Phocaeicola coprophilus DSM 18228 = JCM 13818]QRO24776.1 CRISPR-associated endonuclease Cas2 [Phocaeicola coprophilus]
MYILVTYDVDTTSKEGARRLRCVAKACLNYGQRVQNSVFECEVTEAQLCTLKNIIGNVIDTKQDSVRFYYLNRNIARRVEVLGKETSYDVNDVMII